MRPWYVSAEGFRALRHSCFLSREACAKLLGVSVRTVRHWDAGRNRVPWSAVRLLRLRRRGDMGALHDAWSGWVLNERTAELVSPNGYSFQPGKLEIWPVLCEQARFWRNDFGRRAGERLEGASRGAAVYTGTGESLSCPALLEPQRIDNAPPQPTAFLAFGWPMQLQEAQRSAAQAAAKPMAALLEQLRTTLDRMTAEGGCVDVNMASLCSHMLPISGDFLEASMPSQTALVSRLPPVAKAIGGVPSANRGLKVESDATLTPLGFSPSARFEG